MPKQVKERQVLLLLLLEIALVSSFSPFHRQTVAGTPRDPERSKVQQAGSFSLPHQTHRLRRCRGRAEPPSLGAISSYLDSLSIPVPAHSSLDHGDDPASNSHPVVCTVDVDELAKKYGLSRDGSGREGYDEASDAVGPGIYGGSVLFDISNGNVVHGEAEYEDHGRPGPKYDGRGYSLMTRGVQTGQPDVVENILRDFPHLVNEVSTGGGKPLHNAGMSSNGQHCAQVLIDYGADLNALDAYGYNALHRMASNDLDIGAEALVKAGLDPNFKPSDGSTDSPIEIAQKQRNVKFLMCMQRLGHYD